MVLRRLFGRSDAPAPREEPAAPAPADEAEAVDEPTDAYDGPPEGGDDDVDASWRRRAADVIPGGACTGSKRPDALYGSAAAAGPTHYSRASGCHIVTAGGRTLIDCTMALGSVAIGYADEAVLTAVVNALGAGNVAGLSHTGEVEVAERLSDVIPCAEQVRFMKSGAEAVAAAVRIARAATGRDAVIGSGYFGWLDWASGAKGVPAGVRADFASVPFDDVAALDAAAAAAAGRLAAVVIEPVVERLPSDAWLARARAICDREGAVLIFDELKTGFRLRPGGYQERSGVHPDLATFGKAMANGFPIAAVVGRAAVMEAARDTWISSTLAGESAALAAAGAVLDWHERSEVCDSLWKIGEEMQGSVRRALDASGLAGVRIEGIAPMWLLRFDDPRRETRFLELALDEGVLFKRGAYNYASLAHDEEVVIELERVASHAFVALAEEGDDPEGAGDDAGEDGR